MRRVGASAGARTRTTAGRLLRRSSAQPTTLMTPSRASSATASTTRHGTPGSLPTVQSVPPACAADSSPDSEATRAPMPRPTSRPRRSPSMAMSDTMASSRPGRVLQVDAVGRCPITVGSSRHAEHPVAAADRAPSDATSTPWPATVTAKPGDPLPGDAIRRPPGHRGPRATCSPTPADAVTSVPTAKKPPSSNATTESMPPYPGHSIVVARSRPCRALPSAPSALHVRPSGEVQATAQVCA